MFTFVFFIIKQGCELTPDMAKWAIKELLKNGEPSIDLLTLLCQI
jgi:hypothetical protein